MRRGTTPNIEITTNIDLTEASVLFVTFAQKGKVIIDLDKASVSIDPEGVRIRLTQDQTLSLVAGDRVEIQIRAKMTDGTAYASNVMTVPVWEILKEGVI